MYLSYFPNSLLIFLHRALQKHRDANIQTHRTTLSEQYEINWGFFCSSKLLAKLAKFDKFFFSCHVLLKRTPFGRLKRCCWFNKSFYAIAICQGFMKPSIIKPSIQKIAWFMMSWLRNWMHPK